MNFKRNISTAAAFSTILACSLTVFPSKATLFQDTESHWAKSYIETVVDSGMMSGTGGEFFSPDKAMTMGEFSVVMVNGGFGGRTLSKSTDEHWADIYLNVLIENDILCNSKGEPIVTMGSGWQEEPVLRYQVVSMVARLMDDKYPVTTVNHAENFTDFTSDFSLLFYKDDFNQVVESGVMKGVSETEFGVKDSFTRGAACVVIKNLLSLDLLETIYTEIPETPEVPEITTPTTPTVTPTVPTSPTVTPYLNTTVTPSTVILPADSNKDGILTQAEINSIFNQYKEEYPQGTRWNNDNSYYSSALRINGYGCAGWVFMLSDAIFGTQPRYEITRDQLQIGDFWHTGTHWGMIMDIKEDSYITTEGNVNSSIYWDYTRKTSYLTESVKYYSRYPQV